MVDVLKEYIEKRTELLKLEATEKSAIIIAEVFYLVLISLASVGFVILLNIGLGLLIGSLIGNYGVGMLIMAGISLLAIIITVSSRRNIKNSLMNIIIKSANR